MGITVAEIGRSRKVNIPPSGADRTGVSSVPSVLLPDDIRHINHVHLSLAVLVHRIDADLTPITAPPRMQVAPVLFRQMRVSVETPQVDALIVNPYVAHVFDSQLVTRRLLPATPVEVVMAFAGQTALSQAAREFVELVRGHFRRADIRRCN